MTLPMMGNPPPAKSQLNGISGAGWQVKSSPQSPWHPRVVSSSPVKLIIHWMCLNSWRTAFIWLCRPVTFFFVRVWLGARICIERWWFWFCFFLILCGTTGQGPVLLSPGIHSFPFKLGLPLGLPSTFLGKHGWVQYYCKAVSPSIHLLLLTGDCVCDCALAGWWMIGIRFTCREFMQRCFDSRSTGGHAPNSKSPDPLHSIWRPKSHFTHVYVHKFRFFPFSFLWVNQQAFREPAGLLHKNQQVFIVMNPIDLNLEPPILAVSNAPTFFVGCC